MTCNALGNGHVPHTLRTSGIKENLRFKSQEMQLFIQLTFDMRLEGVEPSVVFVNSRQRQTLLSHGHPCHPCHPIVSTLVVLSNLNAGVVARGEFPPAKMR